MRNALATLCILLSACTLQAQTPLFRVSTTQRVEGSTLVVDFFIQRTSGADFALTTSDFSVFLTPSSLNIAAATIDHNADGKWDDGVDATGYFDLSLRNTSEFVVFKVNGKSAITSRSPGKGQPVSTDLQRIGRVRIPITNPWGTNTLRWRLPMMGVLRWDATSIKNEGIFETPAPDFPLCSIPGQPLLTGPADSSICSNELLTLRSSFAGLNLWYRDGQLLDSVRGTDYRVLQPGTYRVQAQQYNCTSELSAGSSSIAIKVVPEPGITQQARLLVCNLTEALQWYRNGVAIPGATSPTYLYSTSGVYTVVVPSSCGPISSNAIFIDLDGTPVVEQDNSNSKAPLAAFPNPYPTFTFIAYEVQQAGMVELDVYTQLGVHVGQLVREVHKPGRYRIRFSAQAYGYPIGTYVVKLSAPGVQQTINIIEGV
jgi:hypothetical protein